MKTKIILALSAIAVMLAFTGCEDALAGEGTHYQIDGYEFMDFQPFYRSDYRCTANLSTGGVSCYPKD